MKFIVTGTEVVRGRGKVHWVPSGATTYVTGCGRKTDNMLSSYHSNVTHLTCEECQTACAAYVLRSEL